MKILVTGPAGSGKSTQAVLLTQDLGVSYICAGEIFRNLALLDDSKTAAEIAKSMSQGKLIPTNLAEDILNKRLALSDCRKGFVSDGFPRNIAQLQRMAESFDEVLYVKVSDEVCIHRLLLRNRGDDTKESISERLKIYHAETTPLLEIFRKQQILLEINGEQTIAQIHSDIINKLEIDDIH